MLLSKDPLAKYPFLRTTKAFIQSVWPTNIIFKVPLLGLYILIVLFSVPQAKSPFGRATNAITFS